MKSSLFGSLGANSALFAVGFFPFPFAIFLLDSVLGPGVEVLIPGDSVSGKMLSAISCEVKGGGWLYTSLRVADLVFILDLFNCAWT
jgi:hypothetical protein